MQWIGIVYSIEVTWSELSCFRCRLMLKQNNTTQSLPHWCLHYRLSDTGSYIDFRRSAAFPCALRALCRLALVICTEAWEEGQPPCAGVPYWRCLPRCRAKQVFVLYCQSQILHFERFHNCPVYCVFPRF